MWQRTKRPLLTILAVQIGVWAVLQVITRAITRGDQGSDEFRIAAIWFGREFHSRADRFKSGSGLALMGGIKIDLCDATLDPDGATLELSATMGGIEVNVPEDWAVDIDERSILGGFAAKVTTPDDLPDDAPSLHIRVRSVMGGAAVTAEPDGRR
jgi:hypothetical protein